MNNHPSSKLVSNMKTTRFLLIALFALAAPFAAAQSTASVTPPPAAAKPADKGPAKPYPLKICLVTDSDLDSMGDEVSFVYQGREIKFCCKPCEKKFLRAPEKYLAKLAAQEAGKK
jgi:YHS domain-containing protein